MIAFKGSNRLSHIITKSFVYSVMPAVQMSLLAAANAADCTALKNTNVPYQLIIQKDVAASYPVQIFRGADLTRKQLSPVKGKVFVAVFQANFQLGNPGAQGENIKIVYSVPTDRYIWAQGTRIVHGKSIIDGKPSGGPGFEATYTMLPDEIIFLGSCSFSVKHYKVRQESPSITMMSEVWFSPELNTTLKTRISTSIASTGKTTATELEARSIDTDFTPLR